MPAKKQTEPKVARSATSSEVPKGATDKTPERIKTGDWVMLASPLFVQLHLVAKARAKEDVTTECGIRNPPDFSGRPKGPRCKHCVNMRDVTAK